MCSQPTAGQQPGAQRSQQQDFIPTRLQEDPRHSGVDDGALLSNGSTQLLTEAVPARSQHVPCPHSCSWRPFHHPIFGGVQTSCFPAGSSSQPLYLPHLCLGQCCAFSRAALLPLSTEPLCATSQPFVLSWRGRAHPHSNGPQVPAAPVAPITPYLQCSQHRLTLLLHLRGPTQALSV